MSPEPEPEPASDSDPSAAYDPDQPMGERRAVQRRLRELGRNLQENADEYLKDDSTGLHQLLLSANEVNRDVKQTAEAVIDSRLLVTAADLSYKRIVRITQGRHAEGVDTDEFVSKCLSFMLHGDQNLDDDAPQVTSTQRQNRRRAARGQEGDDSDDESGDMLNWAYLGRYGCLSNVGRPSLPGHLLGPLSVEKKVRKITQRSARFRPNNLVEVRPEVVKTDDLAKVENDMAVICRDVLDQLIRLQKQAQDVCAEAYQESEEDGANMMREMGLRSTGGLDLLRFVINPRSFGQSVENMFYVSFLIRDGKVEIECDEDGIPAIGMLPLSRTDSGRQITNSIAAPVENEGDEDESDGGRPVRDSDRHATKRQAVFELDMPTWQDIVRTLGIQKSMIEHRREDHGQGPSASGWYT